MGSFEVGALEGEDFVQASMVLLIGQEAGVEELCDELLCLFGGDDAGAEAEYVHVVVLYALACGIFVVADGGADAGDLVGGHGGADAAAADYDAAPSFSGGDGFGDGAGEVGEVVKGVEGVGSGVVDVVAEALEEGEELLLEGKAAVVGAYGEGFVGGGRVGHGCGRLFSVGS